MEREEEDLKFEINIRLQTKVTNGMGGPEYHINL